MGNHCGTVHWNSDNVSLYDKLDALRKKHNLNIDVSYLMPREPGMQNYAVEIKGLSIVWNGQNTSESKIKSFLYDAEQMFIKNNATCSTKYQYLPL